MGKYVGLYKENGLDKQYALEAKDIFEAQDRLSKIEESQGIYFHDIGPADEMRSHLDFKTATNEFFTRPMEM